MSGHLLCFGFGFCAAALAKQLQAQNWQISATCRKAEKAGLLEKNAIRPLLLDGTKLTPKQIGDATHILLSAAPDEKIGDPILALAGEALQDMAAQFAWAGYLSTTAVYGDHGGAWVDENTPLNATTKRGHRRIAAEKAWQATDLPMHYFRLAGIYGPGRNALKSLENGTARRIDKPGQVFSRIHVEDIAQILMASMAQPNRGRAYNLCDDEPAPPQKVVEYAASLMKQPPPPLLPFDKANLSPMAYSFYSENKRVKNTRVKTELEITLKYPTYREGLTALWESRTY
ncbi:MAG: SDR family oxidoreductase [Alphaproteobacteria bacterium]|nr:SDR family oxidoreductase [Alphaproteobacteria bacterium]